MTVDQNKKELLGTAVLVALKGIQSAGTIYEEKALELKADRTVKKLINGQPQDVIVKDPLRVSMQSMLERLQVEQTMIADPLDSQSGSFKQRQEDKENKVRDLFELGADDLDERISEKEKEESKQYDALGNRIQPEKKTLDALSIDSFSRKGNQYLDTVSAAIKIISDGLENSRLSNKDVKSLIQIFDYIRENSTLGAEISKVEGIEDTEAIRFNFYTDDHVYHDSLEQIEDSMMYHLSITEGLQQSSMLLLDAVGGAGTYETLFNTNYFDNYGSNLLDSSNPESRRKFDEFIENNSGTLETAAWSQYQYVLDNYGNKAGNNHLSNVIMLMLKTMHIQNSLTEYAPERIPNLTDQVEREFIAAGAWENADYISGHITSSDISAFSNRDNIMQEIAKLTEMEDMGLEIKELATKYEEYAGLKKEFYGYAERLARPFTNKDNKGPLKDIINRENKEDGDKLDIYPPRAEDTSREYIRVLKEGLRKAVQLPTPTNRFAPVSNEIDGIAPPAAMTDLLADVNEYDQQLDSYGRLKPAKEMFPEPRNKAESIAKRNIRKTFDEVVRSKNDLEDRIDASTSEQLKDENLIDLGRKYADYIGYVLSPVRINKAFDEMLDNAASKANRARRQQDSSLKSLTKDELRQDQSRYSSDFRKLDANIAKAKARLTEEPAAPRITAAYSKIMVESLKGVKDLRPKMDEKEMELVSASIAFNKAVKKNIKHQFEGYCNLFSDNPENAAYIDKAIDKSVDIRCAIGNYAKHLFMTATNDGQFDDIDRLTDSLSEDTQYQIERENRFKNVKALQLSGAFITTPEEVAKQTYEAIFGDYSLEEKEMLNEKHPELYPMTITRNADGTEIRTPSIATLTAIGSSASDLAVILNSKGTALSVSEIAKTEETKANVIAATDQRIELFKKEQEYISQYHEARFAEFKKAKDEFQKYQPSEQAFGASIIQKRMDTLFNDDANFTPENYEELNTTLNGMADKTLEEDRPITAKLRMYAEDRYARICEHRASRGELTGNDMNHLYNTGIPGLAEACALNIMKVNIAKADVDMLSADEYWTTRSAVDGIRSDSEDINKNKEVLLNYLDSKSNTGKSQDDTYTLGELFAPSMNNVHAAMEDLSDQLRPVVDPFIKKYENSPALEYSDIKQDLDLLPVSGAENKRMYGEFLVSGDHTYLKRFQVEPSSEQKKEMNETLIDAMNEVFKEEHDRDLLRNIMKEQRESFEARQRREWIEDAGPALNVTAIAVSSVKDNIDNNERRLRPIYNEVVLLEGLRDNRDFGEATKNVVRNITGFKLHEIEETYKELSDKIKHVEIANAGKSSPEGLSAEKIEELTKKDVNQIILQFSKEHQIKGDKKNLAYIPIFNLINNKDRITSSDVLALSPEARTQFSRSVTVLPDPNVEITPFVSAAKNSDRNAFKENVKMSSLDSYKALKKKASLALENASDLVFYTSTFPSVAKNMDIAGFQVKEKDCNEKSAAGKEYRASYDNTRYNGSRIVVLRGIGQNYTGEDFKKLLKTYTESQNIESFGANCSSETIDDINFQQQYRGGSLTGNMLMIIPESMKDSNGLPLDTNKEITGLLENISDLYFTNTATKKKYNLVIERDEDQISRITTAVATANSLNLSSITRGKTEPDTPDIADKEAIIAEELGDNNEVLSR